MKTRRVGTDPRQEYCERHEEMEEVPESESAYAARERVEPMEDSEDEDELTGILSRSPRTQVIRDAASRSQKAIITRRSIIPVDTEFGVATLNIIPLMLKMRLVSVQGPIAYRGLPSPIALMRQCGIEKITAWQLVKHPDTVRQIDLRTLAKLCYGLNCTPGDILTYKKPRKAPITHRTIYP